MAARSNPKKPSKVGAKPGDSVDAVDVGAPAGAADLSVTLGLRDLVERVSAATGGKRPEVKRTVTAVLAEIGRALDAGEAFNLPPLGKGRVKRAGDAQSGQGMVLKLRRGGKGKDKQPLAEPDEAG